MRWLAGTAAAAACGLVMLTAAFGAAQGLQPPTAGGYGASPLALRKIPPLYLRLYRRAGQRYGVDWAVLAAIGKIETDHGRSRAPGVRSGVNSAGCCAGPMQFMVRPHPSTWDVYGAGGDVYDPRDAVPAAARYLVAAGAPGDYRVAIYAYNHAEWYVDDVLAQAALYRGAPRDDARASDVLGNPRVQLTPGQRADITAGGLDPRLLATLAWAGERHTIVVTSLRADHAPGTNHEAGRAADIGAVDGGACDGSRAGPCADLVRELAAVGGELRSTELIYCWDPDGPGDPRGFARADHCDHVHVGFDA